MTISIPAFIEHYRPCDSAVDWLLAQPDLKTAWDTCPRADWLLWALRNTGYADGRTLRLLACDFVRYTPVGDGRTVWNLLADERSRSAVETSERYANELATDVELAAARAAGDAAWAAASDAAAGAAAWAAAWAAAKNAAAAAQADMVRARIGWADIALLLALADTVNEWKDADNG